MCVGGGGLDCPVHRCSSNLSLLTQQSLQQALVREVTVSQNLALPKQLLHRTNPRHFDLKLCSHQLLSRLQCYAATPTLHCNTSGDFHHNCNVVSCCVQVFEPLVEKCKKLNRAMRIGTNHGSLSARILSYYGDTPRGMVESAFEFANICRNLDYHNFLFSMKASNPLVMVQAYRLLAEEMYSAGWDYPLHLGVTEVRKPPL